MTSVSKPTSDAPVVETTAAPTAIEWRAAMGYFPSGVTIVTTWDNGAPVASTVNAFSSISLDPPLLMVSLDKANPILNAVKDSGLFGVNILCEDSGPVAIHFAKMPDAEDRFATQPWRSVGDGAPQLDAAPVFIDCKVEDAHLAGDHWIFIGRGVRTEHTSAAAPLLYHKGGFSRLGRAD